MRDLLVTKNIQVKINLPNLLSFYNKLYNTL
jgi:hypothetical protein